MHIRATQWRFQGCGSLCSSGLSHRDTNCTCQHAKTSTNLDWLTTNFRQNQAAGPSSRTKHTTMAAAPQALQHRWHQQRHVRAQQLWARRRRQLADGVQRQQPHLGDSGGQACRAGRALVSKHVACLSRRHPDRGWSHQCLWILARQELRVARRTQSMQRRMQS